MLKAAIFSLSHRINNALAYTQRTMKMTTPAK